MFKNNFLNNKEDRRGATIILAVALVFGILLTFAGIASLHQPKYDKLTLCPIDIEYPSTSILVDKTDPWTEKEKNNLRELILAKVLNLEVFERLRIYIVENKKSDKQAIFDFCNPMRGDQVNPLYQNPMLIQKKFMDQFGTPLNELLCTLVETGRAKKTKLIDSVYHIAETTIDLELILISDLMENSNDISFYDKKPCYSCWTKYANNSLAIEQLRIVKVKRNIRRSKERKINQFWEKLFQQHNIPLTWEKLSEQTVVSSSPFNKKGDISCKETLQRHS